MVRVERARLTDRSVVGVSGPDAAHFLDNLACNDLDGMSPGEARFAALLSPQGKILFEFYVVATADGFLLDTRREKTAELVKRLGLYKLRAKVTIEDLSGSLQVSAAWGSPPAPAPGATIFADPREPRLGWRTIAPIGSADGDDAAMAAYGAHRVACGVPEGGHDFPLGDAFPHEADYDLQHGVSFRKGCYVGQEVVARMHHKTVVRKRVVRVAGDGALATGGEVKAGDAVIGTLGTVAGREALAMVRLDRVAEALDKGQPVTSGGAPVDIDAEAIARYRAGVAARAANP